MATIAVGAPPAPPAPEAQPRTSWFAERGPAQFFAAIGAVLGVWIVLFILLRGRNTLALAPADTKTVARLAVRPADLASARAETPTRSSLISSIRSGR